MERPIVIKSIEVVLEIIKEDLLFCLEDITMISYIPYEQCLKG